MIAVQIGANRGNDDFTQIIKNKKIEMLILVEPLDFHNESLNECYKEIKNKVIKNLIITNNINEKKKCDLLS